MEQLKLEIMYKDINSIVGYINNTRVHSQEQIEQIKASINEFGMCNPIGLHNDTIIFGHGRWEALKQLNYKEVPTIDLSHLSEVQKKALIIADNKIALNSDWDTDLLQLELQDLDDMGFDFNKLGLDFDELDFEEFDEEDDLFEDTIENKKEKIKLSVECNNDTDKQQLKEELLSRGYLCQ